MMTPETHRAVRTQIGILARELEFADAHLDRLKDDRWSPDTLGACAGALMSLTAVTRNAVETLQRLTGGEDPS